MRPRPRYGVSVTRPFFYRGQWHVYFVRSTTDKTVWVYDDEEDAIHARREFCKKHRLNPMSGAAW